MWLDSLLYLVIADDYYIGKEPLVILMNGSPGPPLHQGFLSFQGLSAGSLVLYIPRVFFRGSCNQSQSFTPPRPNVIADSAGEGETSGGSSPFTAGTCTRSSKGSVIPFMHDLPAFDFNSAPLVWPRYWYYCILEDVLVLVLG
jgi:hypothetical protein